MNIRAATAADFEQIAALVDTPEEQFLVFPAGHFPFDVKQVHRLWGTREALTVLTVDDRVAGFANLYDRKPTQSVFIGNVVVDRRFRGRGLGRALMEHMLTLAFSTDGLPEARVSVFAHNQPALQLYLRLGFQPYAAEARTDPLGRPVSLLHMRLPRPVDWRQQGRTGA